MIVAARFGAGTGVDFRDYALFLPGVAVALVVAVVASGWLGRVLRQPRGLALGLALSLGVIAAATLTPSRDALLFGSTGSGTCDVTSLALPTLHDLRTLNDTSLNIALFVPLGLVLGAMAWSGIAWKVVVSALAIPVGIELVQLVVTPLDRSCQAVDVVDNEIGLVVGLAVAFALVIAGRLAAPTRHGRGPAGPDQRDAT